MNVIKWIRGWFRKPKAQPIPVTYNELLMSTLRSERGKEIEAMIYNNNPLFQHMKLAKLHKDLDDCKKRLEAAVKAKKGGVPALRKELQEKKTQILREET